MRDTSSAGCLRCGYDLRGEIERWTETCPLEGRCVECGLDFTWTDVLSPSVNPPRWSVEGARTWLGIPGTAVRTLAASLLAPWFWGRFLMMQRVRRGRLVAYLGFLCVVLYASFAIAHGALMNRTVDWLGGPVSVVSASPSSARLEAMALPFTARSPGTVAYANGFTTPISSPRELFLWYWLEHLDVLVAGAIIPVATVAAFLFVPISRRRAKVKWDHLIRIAAYGYGPIALTIPVGMWLFVEDRLPRAFYEGLISPMLQVLLLAWVPFHLVWWTTAMWRYLRMSHVFPLAAALTAIGILTAVVLLLGIRLVAGLM